MIAFWENYEMKMMSLKRDLISFQFIRFQSNILHLVAGCVAAGPHQTAINFIRLLQMSEISQNKIISEN